MLYGGIFAPWNFSLKMCFMKFHSSFSSRSRKFRPGRVHHAGNWILPVPKVTLGLELRASAGPQKRKAKDRRPFPSNTSFCHRLLVGTTLASSFLQKGFGTVQCLITTYILLSTSLILFPVTDLKCGTRMEDIDQQLALSRYQRETLHANHWQ